MPSESASTPVDASEAALIDVPGRNPGVDTLDDLKILEESR
jgi:hypothetical protein